MKVTERRRTSMSPPPRAACIGPLLVTFAAMAVLFYIASRHYYQLYSEKDNLDGGNLTVSRRGLFKYFHRELQRDMKRGIPHKSVCRTPECIKVANYVKSSVNGSADPCQDFYEFACGNWKHHNHIPKSYNEFNTFSKLSHEIEKQLNDILADNVKLQGKTIEPSSVRKAKSFYQSCMDVDEIERLGALPMLNFIKSMGSWAVAGKRHWNKKRWNIYKVLKHIQKLYYPASPFFSVEVTNDHLNSTKHLIKIEQSGLSLQREIYFRHPEMVKIYEDYMAKVAVLLKAEPSAAKTHMKEVMKFETALAKLTASEEEKAEGLYQRMKIKQLMHLVPQFPWMSHIKYIFPAAHITKTDVILSTSPKYLRSVAKIIKTSSKHVLSNYMVWQMIRSKVNFLSKPFRSAYGDLYYKMPSQLKGSGVSSTESLVKTALLQSPDPSLPKNLLSDYVMWQMIREKVGLLSSPFRQARVEFNRKITGVKNDEDRWRTCTSITNDNMGVPIGSIYIKKHFDDSRLTSTGVMIDRILDTFKERVKKHEWIDNKTTEGILNKAMAVVSKVGYANYVKKPESLRKRFNPLEVDPKRFFWNNVNVDKWVRKRLFKKLRKAVDSEKWPMFPQTINAMYQFYENEIVIPAGILRPPFYYTGSVPRSLSFGAIGSIIGHELTHGFDNTGRRFDKDGNIISEWWETKALKEFNKKASCIEKQYSKYKIQDKYPVNGKVTLGENIADNGGTKLSYYAYVKWLKDNGKEKSLPGLSFTNKQLFFIGYAQEYCGISHSKTEYMSTLSEVHAPAKFRVIGTLSNSEGFSKAFHCKLGTPMNPRKKCEVW